SNFAAWQVIDADWVARSAGYERFISAQNKYSIYDRAAERELVPACEQVGVGILPYYPLEYGLLTGKYRRGESAPEGSRLADRTDLLERADFDRLEAIERFAAERGISMLDVAIGGLAAHPAGATVRARVPTPEQVMANAADRTDLLERADFDRLEAIERFAAERGISMLDVAIGGLAAQPAVASVIAGVTRPEQVMANVAAGSWQPTVEDLAVLDAIGPGR